MILQILIIISLVILTVNIYFLYIFPKFNRTPQPKYNYLYLSVVVAFKDEETNLAQLISAIDEQVYPKDKFEVILVDDGSRDNSFQKAIDLTKTEKNYKVIKAENKKYAGKRGALDSGISRAKHPYIVITDADCIPAKNWLLGYSEKFIQQNEFIFGSAPFVQEASMINRISCFENLRSTILTFVSAKLGIPYSAAARNMGFEKAAFDKLGGFEQTLQTASGDDDLLIREAAKRKLNVGTIDYKDTYVLSYTKNTFNDYLTQKARHTQTSHHYLKINKIFLGFWHSSNILIVLTALLIPFNVLFILPLLIKLLSDFIVVWMTQFKMSYDFKWYYIPFLQVIYEVFLIINFFSSFRKSIPWKE